MKKFLSIFLGGFLALGILLAPSLAGPWRNETSRVVLSKLLNNSAFKTDEQTNKVDQQIEARLAAIGSSTLPIGSLEEFKADNARGMAVLLPQTHIYPGSLAGDPINDSAEIAQKQIYSILSYLNKNNGVNFVMAEGDLYGEVSQNKISTLAEKIDLRNKFANEIARLKSEFKNNNAASQAAQANFFHRADQIIAALDRGIILEGAPYKLKAEGNSIILFGAENKATQDKSAGIVRNYIYQQDRYNQLTGAGLAAQAQFGSITLSNTSLLNSNSTLAKIYELLMSLKQNSSKLDKSDFSKMQSLAVADGQSDASNLITQAESTYNSILNLTVQSNAAASFASLPSRADNPYRSIFDPNRLKAMLGESEKQIQDVIINQRNQETAENFSQALNSKNIDVGAIEYGAGHEEGLINELNKRGISVIAITAQEVLKNQTDQQPMYSSINQ